MAVLRADAQQEGVRGREPPPAATRREGCFVRATDAHEPLESSRVSCDTGLELARVELLEKAPLPELPRCVRAYGGGMPG